MPSFIFNSESRIPRWNYKRFWGRIAIAAMLAGMGLELLLRGMGFTPMVVHDGISWCQRRETLEEGPTHHHIVILGPSFAETDVLISEMEKELDRYRITKLALGGAGGFRVLEDIAEQSRFGGLVLCAVTPEFFTAQEVPVIDQYHAMKGNPGRYEQYLNRRIKTWVQEHLVLAIPPYKEILRTLQYGQRSSRTLCFSANGDVLVHYREQPAAYREWLLTDGKNRFSAETEAVLDSSSWEQAFRCYRGFVQAIRSRGGEVVFFVPPTHPARWAYYQKHYPWEQYLGRIPKETGAALISFGDHPELAGMESYDFAHLEQEDAEVYTRFLLKKLRERGILPRPSVR